VYTTHTYCQTDRCVIIHLHFRLPKLLIIAHERSLPIPINFHVLNDTCNQPYRTLRNGGILYFVQNLSLHTTHHVSKHRPKLTLIKNSFHFRTCFTYQIPVYFCSNSTYLQPFTNTQNENRSDIRTKTWSNYSVGDFSFHLYGDLCSLQSLRWKLVVSVSYSNRVVV